MNSGDRHPVGLWLWGRMASYNRGVPQLREWWMWLGRCWTPHNVMRIILKRRIKGSQSGEKL